jgi:hypothetical protein
MDELTHRFRYRPVPKVVWIAAVSLFVAGLIAWLVLHSYAAKNATTTYMSDLVNNRFDDAYASLCAEDRATMSLAEFESIVRQSAVASATGFSITTTRGTATWPWDSDTTIMVALVLPSGSTHTVGIDLRRTGGSWHVCPSDRKFAG